MTCQSSCATITTHFVMSSSPNVYRHAISSSVPFKVMCVSHFTPNLKVDMLADLQQLPEILSYFADMIRPPFLKKEPLKNYWQNKNLDEGEKFLKNYILNKQYIENDEGMTTYEEIVNDEDEDFLEEEELLVKQDSFERKYNFRFEEPDATETKTFPRNVDETVRCKDVKRTEKRKEVEERKKKEKEKKKEGLKQLKKLKKQEILDKIEKLKQITGNKTLGIDEKELDEDFDPRYF